VIYIWVSKLYGCSAMACVNMLQYANKIYGFGKFLKKVFVSSWLILIAVVIIRKHELCYISRMLVIMPC